MDHSKRKLAIEVLDKFCNSMNAKFKKQQEEKAKKEEIKQVEIYLSPNKDRNMDKCKSDNHCECCGKELKSKKTYSFHASTNWFALPVHLSEEELAQNGIESQGWFEIGAGCKKKFPKGYTVQSTNQHNH
jgi:hypothetical protein